MPRMIVLLSGRVCTGKSTLAQNLKKKFGFKHFSTREFLKARQQNLELERRVMQNAGEDLDRKTKGAWVRDGLVAQLNSMTDADDALIVLDSIRAKSQIDRLRACL